MPKTLMDHRCLKSQLYIYGVIFYKKKLTEGLKKYSYLKILKDRSQG